MMGRVAEGMHYQCDRSFSSRRLLIAREPKTRFAAQALRHTAATPTKMPQRGAAPILSVKSDGAVHCRGRSK